MTDQKFPRYFEQISSGTIMRFDDAKSVGWFVAFEGKPCKPEKSDPQAKLNLRYVTKRMQLNWCELTPSEALAKSKGDKSNE